jgi:hypothetical protein
VSAVAPGESAIAPGRFAGGAWLVPVLLWLFGCFFYFGDLGKWTDDYAFTEVDPITGKAERLWRDGQWVLWRPLMVKINSFLQTVLWEHDWALHLIGALVHAAAALLVWRLARLVGIGRFVSAMAGLLFLTYPGYYHVVFWSTALPIGLAAVMMVAVMMGAVQWSRGRVGWRVIPVLAVGSYVLTCMYEQPGGALGALPLLCLATAPGGQPLRVRLRRAMMVSAPCWAGVGLYVALYWWTMAPGALGTPGSLLRPAEMAAKAYSFCELTGQFYMIRSFKECALMLGLEAMSAHPARAGLLVGAIAGATVLWASTAARGGGARARGAASLRPGRMAGEDGCGVGGVSGQDGCTARRPVLLAAFGAAVFVLALLPVFLVRAYGAPDSRMLYAPAVGLVLLLALAAEGVRALPWPGRVRPASAFAAVFAGMGLFVWFAVMQVGTQSALRQRWTYDVAESARLRELLPNPPAGTVFVPVFMDDMPYKSCWRLNYLFAFGVWSHSWTAMNEPARLYKRSDLFASYGRWEGGPWNYAAADERGLVMRQVLSYRWGPQPYARVRKGPGAGGYRVPWKKVAAFVTDEAGELRLVTHVVFTGPDGEEMTVGIPMALELMKRGKIERLERWLHLDPVVDAAGG